MALDYAASDALMNDATFKGRVKCACLKFADYILGEAPNVPAHNTRVKWANNTVTSPDAAATRTTPTVVMDAAVQDAGATITDAALQTAVETAINKLL
jgi:hypothetical protein